MKDQWFRTTLAALIVAASATSALAQPSTWNVELASGISPTTGEVSDRLTKGWNIGLGAGYEINDVWELDGLFTFNGLGVSSSALQALNLPDGNASLLSLTVGPKIHFPIANGVRVRHGRRGILPPQGRIHAAHSGSRRHHRPMVGLPRVRHRAVESGPRLGHRQRLGRERRRWRLVRARP